MSSQVYELVQTDGTVAVDDILDAADSDHLESGIKEIIRDAFYAYGETLRNRLQTDTQSGAEMSVRDMTRLNEDGLTTDSSRSKRQTNYNEVGEDNIPVVTIREKKAEEVSHDILQAIRMFLNEHCEVQVEEPDDD